MVLLEGKMEHTVLHLNPQSIFFLSLDIFPPESNGDKKYTLNIIYKIYKYTPKIWNVTK